MNQLPDSTKRRNLPLTIVLVILLLFLAILPFCASGAENEKSFTSSLGPFDQYLNEKCLSSGAQCEYSFIVTTNPDAGLQAQMLDGSCSILVLVSIAHVGIDEKEHESVQIFGWPPGATKVFPRAQYDYVGVTCDPNKSGNVLRHFAHMV